MSELATNDPLHADCEPDPVLWHSLQQDHLREINPVTFPLRFAALEARFDEFYHFFKSKFPLEDFPINRMYVEMQELGAAWPPKANKSVSKWHRLLTRLRQIRKRQ